MQQASLIDTSLSNRQARGASWTLLMNCFDVLEKVGPTSGIAGAALNGSIAALFFLLEDSLLMS